MSYSLPTSNDQLDQMELYHYSSHYQRYVASQVRVRVAFEQPDGTAQLQYIFASKTDNGDEFMKSFKAQARAHILPKMWFPWMWKVSVDIALVEYVHTDYLESRPTITTPITINLRNHLHNPSLTAALARPYLLKGANNFIQRYPNTIEPASASSSPNSGIFTRLLRSSSALEPEAIVLRISLNKRTATWILLGLAIVAVASGVVGGVVAKSLATGIEVVVVVLTTFMVGQAWWVWFGWS